MNIQQLINTFGNFIDECAISYPLLSKNKDNILDRCYNLYWNNQGLFFNNTEIFGKGCPKPYFLNYLVINSDEETEHPRNFHASFVLRYKKSENKALTLSDVKRAIQFSKEVNSEKIPLKFLCANIEVKLPKINEIITEKIDIDQLASHISIRCDSTESEQELQKQLNLMYRIFLKFNERDV